MCIFLVQIWLIFILLITQCTVRWPKVDELQPRPSSCWWFPFPGFYSCYIHRAEEGNMAAAQLDREFPSVLCAEFLNFSAKDTASVSSSSSRRRHWLWAVLSLRHNDVLAVERLANSLLCFFFRSARLHWANAKSWDWNICTSQPPAGGLTVQANGVNVLTSDVTPQLQLNVNRQFNVQQRIEAFIKHGAHSCLLEEKLRNTTKQDVLRPIAPVIGHDCPTDSAFRLDCWGCMVPRIY